MYTKYLVSDVGDHLPSNYLFMIVSALDIFDPLIISYKHTLSIIMDLFRRIYEQVQDFARTAVLVENHFAFARQHSLATNIGFEQIMHATPVSEIRKRILDSVIDVQV